MAIKYCNGKKYNTETAICIGTKSDSFFSESLYRKKSGEYFLGFVTAENSGISSKLIIHPISYDTAQRWAKLNLDYEAYSKNFVVNDTKKISVQLDSTSAEIFEKYKRLNNLGTSEAVRKIIHELAL